MVDKRAQAATPFTMHCIVCDAAQEPLDAWQSPPFTSPKHGLIFYSRGGYGSSLYDPHPLDDAHEKLELYVCDGCAKGKMGRIWHVSLGARVDDNIYELWSEQDARARGAR